MSGMAYPLVFKGVFKVQTFQLPLKKASSLLFKAEPLQGQGLRSWDLGEDQASLKLCLHEGLKAGFQSKVQATFCILPSYEDLVPKHIIQENILSTEHLHLNQNSVCVPRRYGH